MGTHPEATQSRERSQRAWQILVGARDTHGHPSALEALGLPVIVASGPGHPGPKAALGVGPTALTEVELSTN